MQHLLWYLVWDRDGFFENDDIRAVINANTFTQRR